MPNALIIWAIWARHLLSHVLNIGAGDINSFEVKWTFEMLIVVRQAKSQVNDRLKHDLCQWINYSVVLAVTMVDIWSIIIY